MENPQRYRSVQPRGSGSTFEDVGKIGAGVSAQDAWDSFELLRMLSLSTLARQ
jgi:hypothetical protein